jgi:hypothetical protein
VHKDNAPGYRILCEGWREPNIQFCTTRKRVRQGCDFSRYLLNTLLNDNIGCIDMDGTHSQVTRGLKIPGLLFAEELAMVSAMGPHLVQRSPTECVCVCVCVIECDQVQQ